MSWLHWYSCGAAAAASPGSTDNTQRLEDNASSCTCKPLNTDFNTAASHLTCHPGPSASAQSSTSSSAADSTLDSIRCRSTQPRIPPGSLNRVPASAGGKGDILTSAGWQVIPYGMWVSRSCEAKLMLTAMHCLLTYLLIYYSHYAVATRQYQSISLLINQ